MIIRFLDNKGRVCEIGTPNIPILIYATAEEKKNISSMPDGACLTLIDRVDDNYDETQSKLFHCKSPLVLK